MTELRLKLFVAGDSPRARQAAENLARACEAFLPGEVEVETVDVLVHPQLADEYRVLTTQLLAALALYPTRSTQ